MEEPAAWLWAFTIIGGPIILGGILAYGRVRNRRRRKQEAAARGREPT